MTYRQLLEQLTQLDQEALDMDVSIVQGDGEVMELESLVTDWLNPKNDISNDTRKQARFANTRTRTTGVMMSITVCGIGTKTATVATAIAHCSGPDAPESPILISRAPMVSTGLG